MGNMQPGQTYSEMLAHENYCPWCPLSLKCLTDANGRFFQIKSKLIARESGRMFYDVKCSRTVTAGLGRGSIITFGFEVDFERKEGGR